MKQIIQSIKTNKTELINVPAPIMKPGCILIKTSCSLVSLGTERTIVEFGNSSIFKKIKQRPDQVKQVVNKLKSEGLFSTMKTVQEKLDQQIPLGYCNVGTVIDSDYPTFKTGDRVVSNGYHAEIVRVPEKLVAKIPDDVTDEEALFTVIGSIGLQGIRLFNPTYGETVVVIGLGLVGLITIQILKANGVNVIGIDIDQKKCEIANTLGVKTISSPNIDSVKFVESETNGVGADGVLITASSQSNKIISQAANMCRKRGKIILVGVIGLNIDRRDFYEKELIFQVSCSYGPGRYDENYEQKGIDYPLPYVRWTEKRNFEIILHSIKNGAINVGDLITNRVRLENYNEIYDNMDSDRSIASIIIYSKSENESNDKTSIQIVDWRIPKQRAIFGIIGSGNFTRSMILPVLKSTGAKIKYIASSQGITSTDLAKKYKISFSTTDYKEILNDPEIDTVLITTRNDMHSQLVIDSLTAKKNVFVEKPLALNSVQLNKIIETYQKNKNQILMVGYNRRFSPHAIAIKDSLETKNEPINITCTMNAGFLPDTHWMNDIKVGGGRIIGEACHLIDLCIFLTGSTIKAICMNSLNDESSITSQNVSILIKFVNGSNAVLNYFSNGSKSYSKERVEVYSKNRTWIIDNFRSTIGFDVEGFKNIKTKLDKGHKHQFIQFVELLKNGGEPLIPLNELINVSRASFAAIESYTTNNWIDL